MTNIIEQFIVDNKISLEGEDSGLNGAFVILSGFALHKGIELGELSDSIDVFLKEASGSELSSNELYELERVYEYAASNNYSAFWKTEKAKKQYKF